MCEWYKLEIVPKESPRQASHEVTAESAAIPRR